jgi:hypothetical protein
MRVLQLTIGTGVLLFMLFMSIRFWGEGQSHRPFDSAFWHKDQIDSLIVIPWEQNFFLEKHPDWILWVDVYRGENENLLVKPWADRDVPVKKLEKNSNPARPLLIDLLKKFPNTRWIINCNDNVENIHLQIVKIIEETKVTDKVILQSEFNTVLTSTKEKAPMLLYGSTIADLTRLKVFDSLWLLPAAPFKGDVYFGPLNYLSRPTINRDIAQELKKRFKKIILGPLKSEEEMRAAKELGADGFFLADPLLWKQ